MGIIIVKKPWGDEKIFAVNKKCTVKILRVTPGNSLSVQYHKKRGEFNFFLTDGYYQLGKKVMKIKKGSMLFTKKNSIHRLFAKNKEVQVLEITFDKYEAEDIVRLTDKYGREGTTKK